MTLTPNKQTISYPKQITKPKTTTPKTNLSTKNYDFLRKLGGSGSLGYPLIKYKHRISIS